jgi:translation initiation factor 2-alpha kinase 3
MERHTVLTALNKGVLPQDFSDSTGEKSGRLEACLRGMLCADAERRLSCKSVRECMEGLVEDAARAGS